jgi:hypothetical protein
MMHVEYVEEVLQILLNVLVLMGKKQTVRVHVVALK